MRYYELTEEDLTPLGRMKADRKASAVADLDDEPDIPQWTAYIRAGEEGWSPEFRALVDQKRKERKAKKEHDAQRDYTQEAHDYAALIQRDCKPFLKQVEDPFCLYKGVPGDPFSFVEREVYLKDRKPIEMNPDYMEAINDFFTQKFGAPFRNSLFVFGAPGEADMFGTTYYAFPIGEFKFLWSPKINDLNYHTRRMVIHTDPNPGASHLETSSLINGMKQAGYRNDDLEEAIDAGVEIMIRSKSYYLLNTSEANKTGQTQLMRDVMGYK